MLLTPNGTSSVFLIDGIDENNRRETWELSMPPSATFNEKKYVSWNLHFFMKKTLEAIFTSKERRAVYYKLQILDAAFNRGRCLSEGGVQYKMKS